MTEHAEDQDAPITLGDLADELAARWPADRRIIVQNVIGWVRTLADGEGFTVLDESTELPPKLADAIRYDYDAVGYRAGRTPAAAVDKPVLLTASDGTAGTLPAGDVRAMIAHLAPPEPAAATHRAGRPALPPYTPDPVDRLRHVVAYHDRQMDDAWAVQASPLRLPGAVQGWTGLTHGDLRALLALIERPETPAEDFKDSEVAQAADGRLYRRFMARGGPMWEPVQDSGYVLDDGYPKRPLTRPAIAPVPQRD